MNSTSGVILVDKPAGISSAGVVARLRRRFSFSRIGHAGTLDPAATGLLIILCGKASKLQEYFLGEVKAYSGTIRLGFNTTSDDTTGVVVEDLRSSEKFLAHPHDTTTLAALAADLEKQFFGPQLQLPPQVSAIKVDGKRAYKSAREGTVVELAPREVFVSKLELQFLAPDLLQYFVRCSKGYYVRSLARDIGRLLQIGGCIETLRRVESTPFEISKAIPLDRIEAAEIPDEFIISIEDLPLKLPRVTITAETFIQLNRGDQRELAELKQPKEIKTALLFVEGAGFGGIVERGADEMFKIRFLA